MCIRDRSTSEESSVEGAMAFVTEVASEEQVQPQAYATTTKTPMFLDPAGKAYALADSGATNVTLNLKHLGWHKADATPVEMTLASGKVAAYLYRDEVFAEDVKTPLCPFRRITRNLEITIEWTKDHCLLTELIAASMKVSECLMTVVQEKHGAKKFAMPKGVKSNDIVKRETYNLDDM
eukprot:4178620-Amphidinium_carterae.1